MLLESTSRAHNLSFHLARGLGFPSPPPHVLLTCCLTRFGVQQCESKTPINISALCAELQKRSVVVGDRETAAAARTSLDFDVSPFTSERCLVRFGVDDLGREDSVTVTQLAPRGAATVDGASLEPGRAFPLTAGSLVDLSGLGNELSFVLLRDSLAHA